MKVTDADTKPKELPTHIVAPPLSNGQRDKITNYTADLEEISPLPTAVVTSNVFGLVVNDVEVEAFAETQRRFSSSLVGENPLIDDARKLIAKVAPTNARVLITGETGTGKELTANDIHLNSTRRDKPFIAINCAAIPKDTIESTLFGHEGGAFTGADGEKVGVFEAANGGTLFLDEVGELDRRLQTKLARVLEYNTFQKVGGTEENKVDVRVLAATNRDLPEALSTGQITRGLYDRLGVFHIHMPPLREYREDIPLIAEHLLEKYRGFVPDKVVSTFSPEAIRKLVDHDWPGNVRELENVIRRAAIFARGATIQEGDIALTTDEVVDKVLENIEDIALSNVTVLISGENGTGKELVARQIYQTSGRRENPLVVINCAALNPNLSESELFGHVKGAFTGATKSHKGYFEIADGGTLFLDEVGELDLNIQTKLLRAIQQGEILVMGTKVPKKVNLRIIATTSKNLEEAVEKNEFREDLYHRLNVVPVIIPPLRERREEIPHLAHEFLNEFKEKENKNIPGISEEAMAKLTDYKWPGNVRELKTVIERAVILASEGKPLQADDVLLDSLGGGAANDSIGIPLIDKTLHPAIAKRVRELNECVTSSDPFNEDRVRLLIVKCRVLQMIIDSGCRAVPEIMVAEGLQLNRNTVRKWMKDFGYDSTSQLVSDLLDEIRPNESNRKLSKPGNNGAKTNKTQGNSSGWPANGNGLAGLISDNNLHPVCRKHLNELVEYVSGTEPVDDYKVRFLVAKYRIACKLIESGGQLVPDAEISGSLQVSLKTLYNLMKRFGYVSARALASELQQEILANGINGKHTG